MSERHEHLTWKTSTYCGTASCVEVAVGTSTVQVRSSTEVAGPRLMFPTAAWAAFLDGVRADGLRTQAGTPDE